MKRRELLVGGAAAAVLGRWPAAAGTEPPFNAMGEKAGELSGSGAILHTRLTARPEADADGAVPGAEGRARFEYAPDEQLREARRTPWKRVTAETDFTHTARLRGLRPGTHYYYRLVTAPADGSRERLGPIRRFRTAPAADARRDVAFLVIGCQKYRAREDEKGHRAYDAMAALEPDFAVWTGDNVYYDSDGDPVGRDLESCRFHWHRMYALERQRSFCARFGGYWEKDDHDWRWDDADPGRNPERGPSGREGSRIFIEQHPIRTPTYRTFRWGRALQIWLPEGRDYRGSNLEPDGPEKSIWGRAQREWLEKGIRESDALFKVVVSATPIVGPDRTNKRDNHSNAGGYRMEGTRFLEGMRRRGEQNLYFCNGDRHWQYHSVHPTGYQEFSASALNQANLAAVPPCPPEIRRPFARSAPGFLRLRVTAGGGAPRILFEFFSPEGKLDYSHGEAHRG